MTPSTRGRPILASLVVLLLAGSAAHAAVVDASTLEGKLIMGYQGWFACPSDPPGHGWVHWFNAGAPTTDMLPDVGELSPAERCASPLKSPDGHTVYLFSSQNPGTVDRHFAWMQQYGLDGVALQRFATLLLHPAQIPASDAVLANVRRGAERHGRVFFLMYDLSGMPPQRLGEVAKDWARLEALSMTHSRSYLHHRGHPLIGLWGLGFAGRPITPQDAAGMLNDLVRVSQPFGGVTVLAGVPSDWRTNPAIDPGWRQVWPRLGVLSPWTVGGYSDDASVDRYRTGRIEPDMLETRRMGIDYMPVVFPGFSIANTMRARHLPDKARFNEIPRRCGGLYWRQVADIVGAGGNMIYNAMFDELDEGTAMLKALPAKSEAPDQGLPTGDAFVTLDVDGCKLPSDWYLRLAKAATESLRHERPLSTDLPLPLPR